MAKVRICLWVIIYYYTLDIKPNARSDWSLDTDELERAYSIMLRTYSWYHTVSAINVKGTMSPQVYVQVDEKHFEIVGPTFSNIVREFRRLLYCIGCKCKRISNDLEKLSIFYGK